MKKVRSNFCFILELILDRRLIFQNLIKIGTIFAINRAFSIRYKIFYTFFITYIYSFYKLNNRCNIWLVVISKFNYALIILYYILMKHDKKTIFYLNIQQPIHRLVNFLISNLQIISYNLLHILDLPF